MKNIQIVLNAILSKNVFEYLLIDRDLRIAHVSLGIMQFLNAIPAEGNDIRDYLPELVGMEEEISKVFEHETNSLSLKTVQKENYYFNIYVDYYDEQKALVLLQNITEITKAQQRALQHSNQTILLYDTLQKIIDGQNTIIFVTDNQDHIVFANKKFLEYFNLRQEELQTKDIKLYALVSEDLNSHEDLYEYIRHEQHKHISINQDTFMIEGALIDAVHHLFTLSKVTDIYQEKKILEEEVELDTLTGVMRKKYFDRKLERLFMENCAFALVVIDIDNFKDVNDRFGHPVGDSVLQEFVKLIKENIRSEDLIARWGGEEFLLVIRIDDVQKALDRIESIRQKINAHAFDTIGHLSASIGVAWREVDDDTDTLLQRADKALYKAKHNGKNRVVFKKREKLGK
jgi:diguanylate cyclase (GGDEF)-like protein/PAS domain S-box-containing protein